MQTTSTGHVSVFTDAISVCWCNTTGKIIIKCIKVGNRGQWVIFCWLILGLYSTLSPVDSLYLGTNWINIKKNSFFRAYNEWLTTSRSLFSKGTREFWVTCRACWPSRLRDADLFLFFLQLYCVNCCFPRRWKYLCRFNSRCGEKKRKTKKNGEITSCNGHRRSYRKCTEHDERLRGFKNNFCCLSICSCRPGDLMTHPRWGATDKIFSSLSPWHRIIYSTAQLRADDFSISIFLLGFRNM